MDSNKNNITSNSTGTDHFFPTSPHFFDPLGLPTFLDSPNYPLTSTTSWPPPAEQTNYPTTNIAAATDTPASSGPTTTSSRPSKKRSRASRRAPTTVLTTDTSNFRAMVQEFTGIPAPPFTSPGTSGATSLHFPRSLINNPPPSFLFKPGGFLPNNKLFQAPTSSSASASDPPISFQSLLHSQVLNLPHPPAAPVVVSSSGSELSLPGVIGLETRFRQQQQQLDPTGNCKLNFSGSGSTVAAAAAAAAHVFRAEKGSSEGRGGDGLLESWVCSSD